MRRYINIPWKLDTKRAFGIDVAIGTTPIFDNSVHIDWDRFHGRASRLFRISIFHDLDPLAG
jgi:hypothetical protein